MLFKHPVKTATTSEAVMACLIIVLFNSIALAERLRELVLGLLLSGPCVQGILI